MHPWLLPVTIADLQIMLYRQYLLQLYHLLVEKKKVTLLNWLLSMMRMMRMMMTKIFLLWLCFLGFWKRYPLFLADYMIVVVANYDSANKSTVSWTRKRIMVKTKKNTAYVSGMRKSSSYEYFLLFSLHDARMHCRRRASASLICCAML